MAKNPAFPFYASDWLGSNRRAMMTLEQQAVYMILLCRQWSDPTCSLPDDDGALAHLSELGKGWLTIGCPLVRNCFPNHPTLEGRIANPKLLELRAERDKWVAKSSEGGYKSAALRRAKAAGEKTSGKSKGGATTVPTNRQPTGNSPSPSPSPSPSSLPKPIPRKVASATPCPPTVDRSGEILTVFDHYRTLHPRSHPKPTSTSKEWRKIRDRLTEGHSANDLKAAIDGCHRTPHNQGINDRGQKYLGLELIMRTADQVSRFMEAPPLTGMSEKERRGRMAGELWVERMKKQSAAGMVGEEQCKKPK